MRIYRNGSETWRFFWQFGHSMIPAGLVLCRILLDTRYFCFGRAIYGTVVNRIYSISVRLIPFIPFCFVHVPSEANTWHRRHNRVATCEPNPAAPPSRSSTLTQYPYYSYTLCIIGLQQVPAGLLREFSITGVSVRLHLDAEQQRRK